MLRSLPAVLSVAVAACARGLRAGYAQRHRTGDFRRPAPSLTANLTAIDGNKTIAEADESRLDTERIQKALDACPKGQAVELHGDGGHNAFLTGPLDLRAGVTLRVARGAILFGSRDPRDVRSAPRRLRHSR